MVRVLALLVGVALLAAAALRRSRILRRRRDQVEAGLRSSDPVTRALALQEIATVGIRPFVAVLLRRVAELTEDDPAVAEVVALVARCQWEPGDDPGVVQLRLWAAEMGRAQPGSQPAAPSPTLPPPEPPTAPTEPTAAPTVSTAPTQPEPHRAAPAEDLRSKAAATLGVPVDRVRFTRFVHDDHDGGDGGGDGGDGGDGGVPGG